jgi:hypothetical protein
MFPIKNGTKLYIVIRTAFKYIFVKKQNNDVLKISQIQKIENNTIKFKHKTSVVYSIEVGLIYHHYLINKSKIGLFTN